MSSLKIFSYGEVDHMHLSSPTNCDLHLTNAHFDGFFHNVILSTHAICTVTISVTFGISLHLWHFQTEMISFVPFQDPPITKLGSRFFLLEML